MPLLADALLLGNEVTYYPYCTATVGMRIMELQRSDLSELEDALVQKVGRKFGSNHTVYGITMPHGHSLYLLFEDERVFFGFTVELL